MKAWLVAGGLLVAFLVVPAGAEAMTCYGTGCDQLPNCKLQFSWRCYIMDVNQLLADPIGTLVHCLP